MQWSRYRCVLVCALAFTFVVHAQNTNNVKMFRQEFILQSVDTDALPPELTDALATGNVELRQQLRYDPVGKHLDVVTFSVMAGSPALTPVEALPCDPLEQFRVDTTTASASGNSVMFAGTVADGAKTSVTNATDGDAFTLSATFQMTDASNAAVYRNISMSAEDQHVYAAGVGFLSTSGPTPKPPVVVAATGFTTTQPETQLDASGSMDPNGSGALSYYWRSVQGPAVLRGCRSVNPIVQFAGGPGQYQFQVTATSAAGVSTDSTVTVTYYGR